MISYGWARGGWGGQQAQQNILKYMCTVSMFMHTYAVEGTASACALLYHFIRSLGHFVGITFYNFSGGGGASETVNLEALLGENIGQPPMLTFYDSG